MVIFRIFRRRIETVIPLTIRSQQTTFRRVISHNGIIRRTAEEIIQRSVAIRHGRIIVSQQRLHNARVRTFAILNIAVIAGFVSSAHKMQRMIIVDGAAIVIMQTNADTILLLNSGIDVIGQRGRSGGVAHATKHGDRGYRSYDSLGKVPLWLWLRFMYMPHVHCPLNTALQRGFRL